MSIIGLNSILKKILLSEPNADVSEVSFAKPTRDWAAGLTRPTINCWFFQVEENVNLRSMEQTLDSPQRKKTLQESKRSEKYPNEVTIAKIRYAPRRFDFSYLVTAWSNEPEDEHKLLWRALNLFNQNHVVMTDGLVEDLDNQPYDIPIVVSKTADIGINMTDLWSVLDNYMHPGFIITSTLALAPRKPERDQVTLVEEGLITVGQSTQTKVDPTVTEDPDTQVERHSARTDPLNKDRHLITKSPIETIDTTIRWTRRTKPNSGGNTE